MKRSLGGSLWHHRDFSRLWFSETISSFGGQFSGIAIPLLAAYRPIYASPFEIGLLAALAILPYPVLGLFVGVWVDRFRKKNIMSVCNIGRMAALASIPVAFILNDLTLDQLFAVALVNGTFSVFFDISYQAYLPILIERKDLIQGNQKLQLSASGASVAGPAAAGLVYAVVGGAFTCAVDALGYVAATVALLDIRAKETGKVRSPDGPRPDFFREMREGVHVVLGNPILRNISGCTATSNLGAYMVGPGLLLYVVRTLQMSSFEWGLMAASGAVGFVVGALLVNKLTSRLGIGRILALSITIGGLAVVYPFASGPFALIFLMAVAFIIGTSSPLYNITQISLRQAITPNRLQGRMNATIRVIVWGTIPVGAIVGGYLAGLPGREAFANSIHLGGIIAGLAGLWIVLSPVIRLEKQPQQIDEDAVAVNPAAGVGTDLSPDGTRTD